MASIRTGGAVVLVLGGLLSCQTPSPRLRLQPEASIDGADYPKMLERWTRKDEVFDGIYSIIYVHATFHAPEFRRAFLERFPEFYGRGSAEGRRLTLADPEAETHWEFFLSASTANQRWNDLARPDSIWKVTLRTDDGPEVEAKVRAIRLNDNLRVFYPYLTPFASGYGLAFPLTTLEGKPVIDGTTQKIQLRISSALGVAELEWLFEPETAGQPVATAR